jgi:F420-non-reducing hydrogenase iron-sulfur subunit
MTFEPKILAIICNWCTYTGADLAGTARIKYQPNVRPVRVMCSGRVDPTFVLAAFARGADGVLVAGCHPGDCHYIDGNYKTMRRTGLLRRMLADYGIEKGRFRQEWVSASEGARWAEVVNEMTDQVRALGPSKLHPGAAKPAHATAVKPAHATPAAAAAKPRVVSP